MGNLEQLLKPDFLVYLDAEIENQDPNTPMESLLVTIKLKLLDEQGKRLGPRSFLYVCMYVLWLYV